jgi:thiol-disulfide isomerase/thioredoxin
MGTDCPAFAGATEWMNGDCEVVTEMTRGNPTLVHFWSVSCGICKENMPKIAEWRDAHKDSGLKIVAVHMPRYEADTDLTQVREAIEKYNITEPVAIDNLHKVKDAFQNEQGFVPAYYLFDADGKLKSFAAGERGFGLLKNALERMLGTTATAVVS